MISDNERCTLTTSPIPNFHYVRVVPDANDPGTRKNIMLDAYRISEVGKILLIALQKCGRNKTFAQIADESGTTLTSEDEITTALSLESQGLINSVTYELPLNIRGKLSENGKKVVIEFRRERKSKSV